MKCLRVQYPNSDIVFFIYSIINPDSFKNITKKWIPEVEKHLPTADEENNDKENKKGKLKQYKKVLIATKIDLRGNLQVLDNLAHKNQNMITTAVWILSYL